ncbi:MAG: hypothetical protein KAH38_04385, partial [Candidatus Hydrogenedentes bacterium]|nr:hypothetical protein [Candidatus Hydrogenedentota bacterium]
PKVFRDVEFYQSTPQQHDFSTPEGVVSDMNIYRVHLASLSQQGVYNFVLHAGVDIPNDGSMNMLFAKMHLEYDVPVKNTKSVKADSNVFLTFSDDPGEEVRRTTVDDLYVISSLAKLQNEMENAMQKSEWNRVSSLLDDMCHRAKKVHRMDLVKEYENTIDKLRKNGNLTQADINDTSQTTSVANSQLGIKAADESVLG